MLFSNLINKQWCATDKWLYQSCVSGLVVEYWTLNFQVVGSGLQISPGSFAGNLKQVLTYCVFQPTQPPILSGMGNEQ